MRLALLRWFLSILEFANLLGDFFAFAMSPIGLAVGLCGASYQLLLFGGCDATTAASLAIAIALTLHTVIQQPKR